MTPTPKKRYYVTGVLEVSIHRGYDINDKTTLLKQKCSTTLCKNILGYFSRSGERLEKYENVKCDDCKGVKN